MARWAPGVIGPCSVVKQRPCCTISALWANPVGGRSDDDRTPGVGEMNAVLHGPHVAPVGQGDHPGRVEPDQIAELVGDQAVEARGVGAGRTFAADLGMREVR